jgi:hypothetical protein
MPKKEYKMQNFRFSRHHFEGVRSYGVRCSVVQSVVPGTSNKHPVLHHQALRGHATLDNEGTALLQNIRNHSPNDKALYPRKCQAQEEEIILSAVYNYFVC